VTTSLPTWIACGPDSEERELATKAFKDRRDRVKKGMLVAVPCAAEQGEPMADLLLAKVTWLPQRHVTLWYLGDKFWATTPLC